MMMGITPSRSGSLNKVNGMEELASLSLSLTKEYIYASVRAADSLADTVVFPCMQIQHSTFSQALWSVHYKKSVL